MEPYQESKYVYCTKGRIFDVMVDLRPGSKTFLKWTGTVLDDKEYRMIYVPENFAHGHASLDDGCEVIYAVSEYYSPESERGIRWNDPMIKIKWPIDIETISEKDKSHPNIKPEEFLMIGNSMKSDILPVLDVGAYAFHIPYHTTWAHEIIHEETIHDRYIELKKASELLNYL